MHVCTYAVTYSKYNCTYVCTIRDKLSHTFDVLIQDRVNYRIDIFIHIFEQTWKTKLDSQLQLLDKIRIIKRTNLCILNKEHTSMYVRMHVSKLTPLDYSFLLSS